MDEFMCGVCRNHDKPFQNSTANSMFARLGTDYEIQGISDFRDFRGNDYRLGPFIAEV